MFQASLAPLATSNSCTLFSLQDTSNYTTNGEAGHALANFTDFRVLNLTYYKGNVITLSSLTSPQGCQAASSNVMTYTTTSTFGDGWYQLVLWTVPTWNSGSINYNTTMQVYNPTDGNIYTCLANNTSSPSTRPDIAPAGTWKLVPNTTYATGLFSKYVAFVNAATVCNLLTALPASISAAICTNPNFACTSDFCSNPELLASIELWLLNFVITNACTLNQFPSTNVMFDLVSKITSCNINPSNFN